MDSLGNDLTIRPGAINWMTAGRGIVHSERTPPHLREQPMPIMVYVHARLHAGAALQLLDGYSERAAFITKDSFRCGGSTFGRGQMVVFAPGAQLSLEATEDTEVMLLGGEPVGERHIWWNFVSSSSERVERAKTEWAMGYGATESFPKVPGDEEEFVPLPE